MQTLPPLETRLCACGCGRTFRVLPWSDQRHASFYECNTAEAEKRCRFTGISDRALRKALRLERRRQGAD